MADLKLQFAVNVDLKVSIVIRYCYNLRQVVMFYFLPEFVCLLCLFVLFVCLSVCLSPGYLKPYCTDFHEIFFLFVFMKVVERLAIDQ